MTLAYSDKLYAEIWKINVNPIPRARIVVELRLLKTHSYHSKR